MEADAYFWWKFWHFAAFISWMSFLFYMPRLFVYHAENIDNEDYCKVCIVQEDKLYHWIGWIAMFGSAGTGVAIWLLDKPELIEEGYFHIKLAAVIVLVLYHLHLGYIMKQFKEGKCKLSGTFFRIYNEVPTISMFFILYAMLIMPNT